MKDGLENIDEIFNQAFDGFEANVDPSVWGNVQNSINANVGNGANSSPQANPSSVVSSVTSKAVLLKIVAGVAVIGTVITSVVYFTDTSVDEETVITENIEIVTDKENEEKIGVENNEGGNAQKVILIEEKLNEGVQSVTDIIPVGSGENIENNIPVVNNQPTNTISNGSENSKTASNPKPPTIKKPAVKSAPIKGKDDFVLKANINVNANTGVAPFTVQFDAVGNGFQYFWEFKDGTETNNGESTVHTFFNEGTYRVELKGMDKNGNTIIDIVTIIVTSGKTSTLDLTQKYISPNGDGIMDVVKIDGKNIEKLEVFVTDMKGTLVYQIGTENREWDGRDIAGNMVKPGTYALQGDAIGVDGVKHPIKQFITVLK